MEQKELWWRAVKVQTINRHGFRGFFLHLTTQCRTAAQAFRRVGRRSVTLGPVNNLTEHVEATTQTEHVRTSLPSEESHRSTFCASFPSDDNSLASLASLGV